MEISAYFIACLFQLWEICVFWLIHVGTMCRALNVYQSISRVVCLDQPECMPGIDWTMHVQHIRCVWMQCTVFAVRVVDRITQWIGIELLAINVCALFDEEHQRKTLAEHSCFVIWCLIESEFVARLISPLDSWGKENRFQIKEWFS